MARGAKGVSLKWYGDDLVRAVRTGGEPALWAAGQVLKREAAGRAVRASGEMAESLYVETTKRTDYRAGRKDRRWGRLRPRSDGVVLVAAGAWYSNLIEDSGAAAHTITAPKGKLLRINGVFRRSVRHPGMRPKPFLGPAVEATRGRMAQEIADGLRGTVTKEMPRAK